MVISKFTVPLISVIKVAVEESFTPSKFRVSITLTPLKGFQSVPLKYSALRIKLKESPAFTFKGFSIIVILVVLLALIVKLKLTIEAS